ncbi:MAG TPA: nuclear transport factor 2 family protein [Acidimicrobiales bacterium]|nr:nuclear transport factor 2 family protein [Acidimicrobiales bacterium]
MGEGVLDAADARLQIQWLEAEYARTWDTGDAEGWADCFVPTGAFEMCSYGTRRARRFSGHDELVAFCRTTTDRYEGIHLINPAAVTLDGERATGWVHFSYHDRDRLDPAVPPRHVVGVYAVQYVRTSAGWRMERRREQAVMADGTFFGVPTAARMWADDVP